MAVPLFPPDARPVRADFDPLKSRAFLDHLADEVVPALNNYAVPDDAVKGMPILQTGDTVMEVSQYPAGMVQVYVPEGSGFVLTLEFEGGSIGGLERWKAGEQIVKAGSLIAVPSDYILRVWIGGYTASSAPIMVYVLNALELDGSDGGGGGTPPPID